MGGRHSVHRHGRLHRSRPKERVAFTSARKENRKIIKPILNMHNGREVKTTGWFGLGVSDFYGWASCVLYELVFSTTLCCSRSTANASTCVACPGFGWFA